MYSLYGQSGSSSPLNTGDVVDDSMLVDQSSSVNTRDIRDTRNRDNYDRCNVNRTSDDASRRDREREIRQTQLGRSGYRHNRDNDQINDFEEFLRRRTSIDRDMVAQDSEPIYEHLFHTAHDAHDFYQPTGFGPLVHQEHQSQAHRVSTSDTSAHLYPGNHNQLNSGYDRQRTYYNLSSTQELPILYGGPSKPSQISSLAPVYYGNTGETAVVVGDLGSLAIEGTSGPTISIDPETSANDVSSSLKNLTDVRTVANFEIPRRRKNVKFDGIGDDRNLSRVGEPEIVRVDRMETETTSMSMEQESQTSGNHYNFPHRHHHHHYHHQRSGHETTTNYDIPSESQSDDFSPVPRKRRGSIRDGSDVPKETEEDAKKSVRSNADKKQNHSEIEKRRRDKMNTYITELALMVPMCSAMSRKLDKLTVLRMAVQHLKTILGTVPSYTEGHCKRNFLNDEELKTLILQAADGFVFAVGCDRGRILYVSESVSKILGYNQAELLGQSWFDILHPKDIAKVKEQLSSSDLSPRERLIDAKTMLPVKTDVPQGVSRLCPGARRSFFCRMKRKVVASGCCPDSQDKDEADTSIGRSDGKYCAIHCTGYLKSWLPAKTNKDEELVESDGDADSCNVSCLVAVGRIQPVIPISSPSSSPSIPGPRVDPIEFVSRHAMDGKFLFVDQRATLVLGFLPQELVGTGMYEYYHHDDIPHLAESHKAVLQSADNITTRIYRFRTKNDCFVNLQSEWWSFRNPWTKEIDYVISKNFAICRDSKQVDTSLDRPGSSGVRDDCNYFPQRQDGLERIISSHVEMSKIGRRIAEEVLNQNQRRCIDDRSIINPSSNPNSIVFGSEFQISTTTPAVGDCNNLQSINLGSENMGASYHPSSYNQMRNNIQLTSITDEQETQSNDNTMEIIGVTGMRDTPSAASASASDEAVMAVIMSLLEADAGLGGPVDFSGLPWPLP